MEKLLLGRQTETGNASVSEAIDCENGDGDASRHAKNGHQIDSLALHWFCSGCYE